MAPAPVPLAPPLDVLPLRRQLGAWIRPRIALHLQPGAIEYVAVDGRGPIRGRAARDPHGQAPRRVLPVALGLQLLARREGGCGGRVRGRRQGAYVGFYLSPWDLHESCYGDTLLYNEFYLAQLPELLTGYGPIFEVWLDGAKSPTAVNMSYDFELWNEAPKSLEQLLDVFYKSSTRNCLLLLNVPPNSSGLIDESDFQTLERFSSAIDSIFSVNLAANPLSVTASSVHSSSFGPKQILDERMETFWAPMQGESTGWIELDLGKVSKFNTLEIREPVNMGQRVMEYHVKAWDSELGWYLVSNSSTIWGGGGIHLSASLVYTSIYTT
ncbi:hypothetical protein SELMODRAFT_431833 [Selaginella moellendorffii]|uniref:F5/8 type C domain-containing protein n=1 Tax=Selaginella moellendorffii TaxID=88036 RepID=D8TDY4_SELML|nr:hypothetical protein SELMODRAFT_431833 [Selaginella moellendorffii]